LRGEFAVRVGIIGALYWEEFHLQEARETVAVLTGR
jgi:hypothetical protein